MKQGITYFLHAPTSLLSGHKQQESCLAVLDWTDTVVFLLQPARNRLDSVLQNMVFQTVLYSIWRERNSRRHGVVWVTTAKISRSIDKLGRNRISSLR